MFRVFLIAVLAFSLTACGIKPGRVSAPEEAHGKPYPAQYPTDVSK